MRLDLRLLIPFLLVAGCTANNQVTLPPPGTLPGPTSVVVANFGGGVTSYPTTGNGNIPPTTNISEAIPV